MPFFTWFSFFPPKERDLLHCIEQTFFPHWENSTEQAQKREEGKTIWCCHFFRSSTPSLMTRLMPLGKLIFCVENSIWRHHPSSVTAVNFPYPDCLKCAWFLSKSRAAQTLRKTAAELFLKISWALCLSTENYERHIFEAFLSWITIMKAELNWPLLIHWPHLLLPFSYCWPMLLKCISNFSPLLLSSMVCG